MNDLLKFISNSLKPFGYHVRKYKAPNILRIPQLEREDGHYRLLSYQGYQTDDANLNTLMIYLRTCVRGNRNVDLTKRLTGAALDENTYRCVRSLVTAINQTHTDMPDKTIELIVLDDRSDEAAQDKLRDSLAVCTVPWTMRQTETTGQGASLYQQFSEAREQNALVYCVEDDYLHEPNGITAMWDFYRHVYDTFDTHSILYPQEHAVLYDDHYPSYIVTGSDRHWRTMRHATHTLFMHGHVVADEWGYIENVKYVGDKKNRKRGSEARTTNKILGRIPGFSPLTPAASHLQFESTMPPLYDWQPLWERNKSCSHSH